MSHQPKPLREEIAKINYNLEAALEFYRAFINNSSHQAILKELGFPIAGSISPVNWEAFAAILTGDRSKDGYGSDLENHEVKSAVIGGSYEYQYHLNGGQTKLLEDMRVNHIFITYSIDYKNIEVRILSGAVLKPTFEAWLPGLIENYNGSSPRQRYRKSISSGFVKKNGKLILKTLEGELTSLT